MAAKIRSRLRDLFRSAIANGLVEVGKNPVEAIAKRIVSVTRDRLTFDDFKLILAEARKDRATLWVGNAMELALLTGQRREDIVNLRFDQMRDGFLWIEQSKGKTGHTSKLKIPLSRRLDVLDISLEQVLKRCRDNVISKHAIHFVRKSGEAMPELDTLSKRFAIARDAAGVTSAPGKTPPTFHEIRSLVARLYTEQYGAEFAQALLGTNPPK